MISNNEFLFEYTQEGDKCLVCHDSYSMESSRNYQNQQGDIISMVFFITIWIKILDKIKVQSGKIDQNKDDKEEEEEESHKKFFWRYWFHWKKQEQTRWNQSFDKKNTKVTYFLHVHFW